MKSLVYSLLWVMLDLYHPPYFAQCSASDKSQASRDALGEGGVDFWCLGFRLLGLLGLLGV